MFRNPMQAILQFAENRGQDAEILTNRLNSVFEPVANMLTPASAPAPAPEPAANPFNIEFAMGPRRPNPPAPQVTDALGNLAASVLGEGATVRVTSGMGEYGSPRHRGGLAADVQFVDPQGNPITLSDERARALALAAPQFGITGFGAGEEYMGDRTFHMDMFPPDQYSADMGHTWGSFGQGVRDDFVSALGETDQVYRNVAGALDMRMSSSGSVAPEERRNVESMLGDILNEIYDPESAVADEKRNSVADLFTGLGVGFGQMSRGDRVDLSEVRDAAERRRNQNIQLRMERAKRAAGASYAMELGDEGLARAIAGGAADVNTLLTKRQQDMVDRRANEAVLREAQQAGMLANVMQEAGGFSESQMEAIRSGANPSAVFSIAEQTRAAEQAAAAQERAESQITFIQEMQQRLMQPPQDGLDDLPGIDPITERALFLAEMDGYQQIYEGGSLNDYMSEARQQAAELRQQEAAGSEAQIDPVTAQNNIDAAQIALRDPNAPDAAVNAARLVFQSEGTMSMAEAAKQITAGGAFAAPPVAAGNPGEVAAAQTVLSNPNATPIQREAAQIVVATNGETGMTQAVASLTAGQAPDDTARMQRIDTLTSAFAEQNLPPERAQELAQGLVDGRFTEIADPETGDLTVYDRTALVSGSSPQDAQVFPPVSAPRDYSPPSILSSEIDYTSAFGPEGVAKNVLNNLGEAVGLGLIDAENREAVQTVKRLATAGRIASAVEVGGRPSVHLLEMFQDLETNPAQLFTGPDTAVIRLQNQRDATVRELQTLDELLAPGARVNAATRGDAYARRLALLPILSDLDVVLGGIRRSYSQEAGVTDAPDVDGPSLDELLQLYGSD